MIDTVLVPLRTTLRAVAVLGLVVAIGAYLIGGSTSAAAVRRGCGQGLDFVRGSGSGRPPNNVERWANQVRIPLRCIIIGVAAVLLMFWPYPTGLVVLWIAIVAVLALAGLDLLVSPARAFASSTGRAATATTAVAAPTDDSQTRMEMDNGDNDDTGDSLQSRSG